MQDFRNGSFDDSIRIVKKSGEVDYIPVSVITTNKSLFIYCKDKKIGEARVQRSQDFDYDAMFFIASQNSKILESL